jgi:hypothetical protein
MFEHFYIRETLCSTGASYILALLAIFTNAQIEQPANLGWRVVALEERGLLV